MTHRSRICAVLIDTGAQSHQTVRAGLKAFGNDRKSTIHVYEGMPHAFNADYRPSYRKERPTMAGSACWRGSRKTQWHN